MKWVVTVTYKNNLPQVLLLDELEELDQRIESGPCFYDVKAITIVIDDEICKTCDDKSGCAPRSPNCDEGKDDE